MTIHRLLRRSALLGLASLALGRSHAQHAQQVHHYTPGTGAANGYTDPSAALGEPSRVTPGDFGGPVHPFNPPYLNSQLVSLGAGGSLTVQFSGPLANDPAHSFGLDFMIFGGAGFIITNAFDEEFNYIGTPATDGGMFAVDAGEMRVSVSVDGVQYFTLDPTLAPAAEGLFPTDGSGDFGRPVDPSLSASDFAGLTLEGIRSLYAGSGGGTGYDLDWAQDSQGSPVELSEVNFVRLEVLSGKIEIDGFSGVTAVPEPSAWALLGLGLTAMVARRRGWLGTRL